MSDIKPGDRVRVLKGAPVQSFGARGGRIQGRSMVVTVDHIRKWSALHENRNDVVWAGSGGYWTSTTSDWVEKVDR